MSHFFSVLLFALLSSIFSVNALAEDVSKIDEKWEEIKIYVEQKQQEVEPQLREKYEQLSTKAGEELERAEAELIEKYGEDYEKLKAEAEEKALAYSEELNSWSKERIEEIIEGYEQLSEDSQREFKNTVIYLNKKREEIETESLRFMLEYIEKNRPDLLEGYKKEAAEE